MEYRLAKQNELDAIYDLVQSTIKEIYPKYYLKEIVDMFCNFHNRENIFKDINDGNTYVLLENGIIIGTGTIRENHITRVYVHPSKQGRPHLHSPPSALHKPRWSSEQNRRNRECRFLSASGFLPSASK